MHPFLEAYFQTVKALCRKYKVNKLYVFGSIVTEQFDELRSDLDFLVEFSEGFTPEQKGEMYFNLLFDLEDALNRKIDLIMAQSFRNPYFAESVDSTKQLIYAA